MPLLIFKVTFIYRKIDLSTEIGIEVFKSPSDQIKSTEKVLFVFILTENGLLTILSTEIQWHSWAWVMPGFADL